MKKEERLKLDISPEEVGRRLLRQEQVQVNESEEKKPKPQNKKPDQK